MQALERWDRLAELQDLYPTFDLFLAEGIEELLGFTCTDIQLDIGEFLENGPKFRMIQAQRSQAKTTITSFYAVWRYIMNPSEIVLIFSAGGDMAGEVAVGILKIIEDWDILECMRPDADDRASTKAYDIHSTLKGYNKSPSLACMGITANMQGRRATLLIADDIESSKNALTETQRGILLHKSRDFTSICQRGDIIYLGTPQSNDSIYNTLPGRGFTIRIWPGRYPTLKEEKNYGEHLAPLIRDRLEANPDLRTGGGMLGDRGKPTDPILLPEETLTDKEIDQGPAYFQLQHMLDTALLDAERYPLRERSLIVANLDDKQAHASYTWSPDNLTRVNKSYVNDYELHYAKATSDEIFNYTGSMMYVDIAAGGQANATSRSLDEMCGVVTKFLHGVIFFKDMDAFVPNPDNAETEYVRLAKLAYENAVNEIVIERNQGGEMMVSTLRNVINAYYEQQAESNPTRHAELFKDARVRQGPNVVSEWASGQKELRILDTLEPLFRRHVLVMDEGIIEKDSQLCSVYSAERRRIYSLFHQMKKITRDRAALTHDDRLDALAGACGYWAKQVVQNSEKMAERRTETEDMALMKEWGAKGFGGGDVMSRRREALANRRGRGPSMGLGAVGALRR